MMYWFIRNQVDRRREKWSAKWYNRTERIYIRIFLTSDPWWLPHWIKNKYYIWKWRIIDKIKGKEYN